MGAEPHAAEGPRELERVLEQVRHHRREDLTIGVDREVGLYQADDQLDPVLLRAETRRDLDLLDKLGHDDVLDLGGAGGQANLGERRVDERAEPDQAASEDVAGAAADPDAAGAQDIEGQHRAAEQVSQLVREESELLVGSTGVVVDDIDLVLAFVLRDRVGDRVVETLVEGAELVGADLGLALDGKLGDGLTGVAVVVDDLRDREAAAQEIVAVLTRAGGDLDLADELRTERVFELLEEHRDPVLELERGRAGRHPLGHPSAAPSDDLRSIFTHELIQHASGYCKVRAQSR